MALRGIDWCMMQITCIAYIAHLSRRDWCADMQEVSVVQPDVSVHQPRLRPEPEPQPPPPPLGHI